MSDTSVVFSILAKDLTQGAFKSVGKGLLELFAGKEILDFGKESVEAASDMQKTQAKVSAIFGESAENVNKFAENAAKSTGMSAEQADSAAAQFGQLGKAAGLSGDELSQFSISSTHLAADLASFNNADPAQVQQALAAAYAGSTKALKPYGILLDQASEKQEAVKLGIIKTTKDALTPQQKVLAAHALIMSQSTSKLGDFSRQSGTLANQQKILTAELDNAKDKIGSGLLPVITKFAITLVGVIGFVQAHSSWLVPLVTGIAAIVAAVKLWTMAQAALDVVMSANPIGLLVIAIGALIAAVVFIATKTHWFQDIWHAAWGAISGVFSAVFNFIKQHWPLILAILTGPIGLAVLFITKHWDQIVGFISKLPGRITSAASGMWDGIKNAFRSAINWIISGWNNFHLTIPGVNTHIPGVGTIGGFTLNTPNLPLLASGGIVKARAGGTLALLGEGGRDEAVVPLTHGGGMPGQNVTVTVQLCAAPGDQAAEALMSMLRPVIRGRHGGNVTLALGGVQS